jgi:hypothetical protein
MMQFAVNDGPLAGTRGRPTSPPARSATASTASQDQRLHQRRGHRHRRYLQRQRPRRHADRRPRRADAPRRLRGARLPPHRHHQARSTGPARALRNPLGRRARRLPSAASCRASRTARAASMDMNAHNGRTTDRGYHPHPRPHRLRVRADEPHQRPRHHSHLFKEYAPHVGDMQTRGTGTLVSTEAARPPPTRSAPSGPRQALRRPRRSGL